MHVFRLVHLKRFDSVYTDKSSYTFFLINAVFNILFFTDFLIAPRKCITRGQAKVERSMWQDSLGDKYRTLSTMAILQIPVLPETRDRFHTSSSLVTLYLNAIGGVLIKSLSTVQGKNKSAKPAGDII